MTGRVIFTWLTWHWEQGQCVCATPACGAQVGLNASGASTAAGSGPQASEGIVRQGDAGVGAASRVPLPQEGPVSHQVRLLCRAACMCLPAWAVKRGVPFAR